MASRHGTQQTGAGAASSSEIARAAEALIGSELDGRYRIDALLGSGGMGAVFRGHPVFMGQVLTDQAVAIKVLRPHLARDPNAVRRFVREARGTLKITSDHAVKVLDFAVTDDGLLYMVLELLQGRTIGAELSSDGRLAPRRAVRVARQVSAALAAAHKVGLIHRDLKPDNLMLVRRGADPDFVKVLDFGLAKVMEGTGEQALSMAALTQGGIVFGTPDYMAPEQALGQPLDARCDVYALGATLFELITGQPPFPRVSPLEVLAAHVRDPAPTLASVAPDLALPPALEALVARCLAKDPDERPASAEALAAELAAIEAALLGGPRVGVATEPVPSLPEPRAEGDRRRAIEDDERRDALDDDDRPATRSRLPWLFAAIAVVAALAVVIAVTARGGDGAHDRAPGSRDAGVTAVAAAALIDAGPLDAAPPPLDAARPRPATLDRTAPDPELTALLDAALAAHRAGQRLRQLTQADAALRRAPRNKTARWLVGDAMVGAGDLRGCTYLRQSGLPAARKRADAAACP